MIRRPDRRLKRPLAHARQDGERRESGVYIRVNEHFESLPGMRPGFLRRPIKGLLLASLLLVGCGGNDEVSQVSENHYPQPSSPGEKLLRQFCSDCHAPPQPDTHKAVEWPNIVFRMQQHRISKALTPMSEDQSRQLVAYMQKNAKDVR